MLSPCTPTSDTECGGANVSPSSVPKAPAVTPTAAPLPGTKIVPGALTLTGVSLNALADPAAVQLLADALTASIKSSLGAGSETVQVAVTSITDVATTEVLFTGTGGSRRLAAAGSQGVTVAYAVLVPSGSSVTATSVQAAILPSGANSVAFAQSVTTNIATAAAASSSPAIQAGLSSPTAAAATPAAAPAPPAAASSPPNILGAAIGGAVGGVVLVLAIFGAYRFMNRAKVATEAQVQDAPKGDLTVRSVRPAQVANDDRV